MSERITLGGVIFERVPRVRVDSAPVDVYKGPGLYLRVGRPTVIDRYLKTHREMEKNDFPVAELVSEGAFDDYRYYIERSLGEKNFSSLFREDLASGQAISHDHFAEFLHITTRFLRAQARTRVNNPLIEEFIEGIHLDEICEEMPDRSDTILARFKLMIERTSAMPYVITHGDFNPANIYREGVIDLENSFNAPFGFDAVCAVETANWFLTSPESEAFAHYRFTEREIAEYYRSCDAVSAEFGLPPVSSLSEEFAFCRGVWMSARMARWPKTQSFRYERLITRYLS